MDCPHCGQVLIVGTERCKSCFGKIIYRKARIRNRIGRVALLAAIYGGLFFSDHPAGTDAGRLILHAMIFLACAIGLWNHRQPTTEEPTN